MKKKIAAFLLALFSLTIHQISAQNNAMYQLEKVTIADFNPKSPVVDSNANAIVLAEIGSSEFVSNSSNWYSLVFKYVKRVLIKNRKAFDEATVKIPVYVGDNRMDIEMIEDFEATTYNLNDANKIEETKLDKSEIYTVEASKVRVLKKFTFPRLKEGSIIEYHCTIKSKFFILIRPWVFQNTYPTLVSQYHVIIPPMFNYYTLRQGYLPYSVDSSKAFFNAYSTLISNTANTDSYNYSVKGNARFTLWSLKDVPAFKSEIFTAPTSTLIPKIYFQLNSINYSDKELPHAFLLSWKSMISYMRNDEDYSSVLKDKKSWLDEDCKRLLNKTNKLEKAKSVYNFVRDNYQCINHDASVWLSEPIKKIYQSKSGSVTDINLMLIAMLVHEGFEVYPVILSTKNNGYVTEEAPILHQYNYVLARVKIDTSYYLLDASEPKLGFGKLTSNCYNHSARVLDDSATLISLLNNDITEEKSTIVFIGNDEKGTFSGTYNSSLGYFESFTIREKLNGKKQVDFAKEIVNTHPSEVEISNVQVDSLTVYDEPIALHYDVKLNFDEADIIYFNPLFNEGLDKNPFSAAQRLYPVEMPAKMNKNYILNMEVPKGYTIDEMPKSTRVKLNNNQGMFEYITVANNGNIQLRSKLVLDQASFLPEDYQTLRDFFSFNNFNQVYCQIY